MRSFVPNDDNYGLNKSRKGRVITCVQPAEMLRMTSTAEYILYTGLQYAPTAVRVQLRVIPHSSPTLSARFTQPFFIKVNLLNSKLSPLSTGPITTITI